MSGSLTPASLVDTAAEVSVARANAATEQRRSERKTPAAKPQLLQQQVQKPLGQSLSQAVFSEAGDVADDGVQRAGAGGRVGMGRNVDEDGQNVVQDENEKRTGKSGKAMSHQSSEQQAAGHDRLEAVGAAQAGEVDEVRMATSKDSASKRHERTMKIPTSTPSEATTFVITSKEAVLNSIMRGDAWKPNVRVTEALNGLVNAQRALVS